VRFAIRPLVAVLSLLARSRAPRWLAPSAAAACVGAIVAGAIEGAGMDSVLGAAAAAGFVALVAVPVLLVASATVRGIWRAWQPGQLGLVEEGGGAPRLAGWLGVLVLACTALASAMFHGTWLLANETAFKPLGVSFAMPAFAVVAALAAVVLSRPVARLLAHVIRRIDTRWQRRGHRSLVTPWRIATVLTTMLAVGGAVFWHFVIRRRLGPIDLSVFGTPATGLAAAAVTHALWSHLPRRIAGPVLGVLALGLVGVALVCWQTQPSLTLSIWGDRPLAGLAIDELFDLDAIRAGMSLAEFRPVPRPGAGHPDIVIVTIDTVRADHTPPYGGNAEMPVLRELAARGAVFDYAFAPSNVTRRSIPSMMIGLAPNRVRGRVVGWALRVDPRHVMLAERMEAAGYDTAGFMCCEGFWGKSFHTGLQRGLDHLEIESNGLALARRAKAWLADRDRHPDGKPLFLWMHIVEPHNWTAGGVEMRTEDERRRAYDRSLVASDAILGELLSAFSNRPPAQAPIVIVSADHGEALGEHGQPYHSTDLYDSQIQVPLVFAGPGIRSGRIPETVSLTDLVPTVLELAGFMAPHDASIDGTSLADLASGARSGNPDAGTAYSAMIKDRSSPGGITSLVRGRWKLIDNGTGLELYDIHSDPHEHSNMISVRPPGLDEVRRLMRARNDAAERSPFE
jgi:arylsulfatase A-like enzyme